MVADLTFLQHTLDSGMSSPSPPNRFFSPPVSQMPMQSWQSCVHSLWQSRRDLPLDRPPNRSVRLRSSEYGGRCTLKKGWSGRYRIWIPMTQGKFSMGSLVILVLLNSPPRRIFFKKFLFWMLHSIPKYHAATPLSWYLSLLDAIDSIGHSSSI